MHANNIEKNMFLTQPYLQECKGNQISIKKNNGEKTLEDVIEKIHAFL